MICDQLQNNYNDSQPITTTYRTITIIHNQLQASLQWFMTDYKTNYIQLQDQYNDLQSIGRLITFNYIQLQDR